MVFKQGGVGFDGGGGWTLKVEGGVLTEGSLIPK